MGNNTICKSEVGGAQCPLSRSLAGDREERLAWSPRHLFQNKTMQSPVSGSAATLADTDPGDSFLSELAPRHENILLCDGKYFKTTTTCRLDNSQQNIF